MDQSPTKRSTLSGAHTIGLAHCGAFASRIYNSSSGTGVDPMLGPTYTVEVPNVDDRRGGTDGPVELLGVRQQLLPGRPEELGMFTSDQLLLTSPFSAGKDKLFARNSAIFHSSFSAAMVKMGNIDILTGFNGEIRKNYRVVN
ncbi:peroxidase 5-like [Zingiber officinale]|uniref:peroxidase 5-like n=1 Tax=Zingiber officinale TaxID=94328 RepID=UPI001C4CCF49|nr:peroxidase 5-like [Zingiber officinale]